MVTHSVSWRRFHVPLLFGLVALTAVVALPTTPTPAFRAPGTRVALETTRFLVVAATAGLLANVHGGGASRARGPFVAALTVLGLADLVFGVIPNLGTPSLGEEDSLLPWIAARYLAGLLFVLAGLEWNRWSTRQLVAAAVAGLVVVQLVLALTPLGDAVTTVIGPDGFPRPGSLLRALALVPMVLFGVGSGLAESLHQRDGHPLERYLSAALLIGVFTQLHEALFPTGLGPVITSADLLRALTAVVLLVGAVRQVRQLATDRLHALAVTQADIGEMREVSSRLQDYVEQEASFRSVVTHELSTPVLTISAHAHLLTASPPMEARDDAVRGIVAEARRLRGLIDRMDDLRELESAALSVETRPTSVMPLLLDAASFGRALPRGHAVRVHAEDTTLVLDPVRIAQVLRNLLTNAAKHAPIGSPIVIDGRRVDNGYRLSVVNEGPAVGPGHVELFEKYRRGPDDVTTKGVGVGLWIVKQIVEAHGGTVAFDRPLDPGARVTISLPSEGSAAR